MLLIYLSLSFIGIIIVSFGIIKNALIINITGHFIHEVIGCSCMLICEVSFANFCKVVLK